MSTLPRGWRERLGFNGKPTLDEYKSWTDDEQAEFLRGEVADAIGNYVEIDRRETDLDDALEWLKEFK